MGFLSNIGGAWQGYKEGRELSQKDDILEESKANSAMYRKTIADQLQEKLSERDRQSKTGTEMTDFLAGLGDPLPQPSQPNPVAPSPAPGTPSQPMVQPQAAAPAMTMGDQRMAVPLAAQAGARASAPPFDPRKYAQSTASAENDPGNPFGFKVDTIADLQRTNPGLDPRTPQAALAYAQQNSQILQRAGQPFTGGTAYLSHFLGGTGASRALSAPPGTPIDRVVSPAAMAQNSFLAGATTDQVAKAADLTYQSGQPMAQTLAAVRRGQGGVPSQVQAQAQSQQDGVPSGVPGAPQRQPLPPAPPGQEQMLVRFAQQIKAHGLSGREAFEALAQVSPLIKGMSDDRREKWAKQIDAVTKADTADGRLTAELIRATIQAESAHARIASTEKIAQDRLDEQKRQFGEKEERLRGHEKLTAEYRRYQMAKPPTSLPAGEKMKYDRTKVEYTSASTALNNAITNGNRAQVEAAQKRYDAAKVALDGFKPDVPEADEMDTPRPTTEAELDALPRDTVFIAPDGSRQRKK